MEIYEKIFARIEELHITQLELSRRTGIATSTICDWKKKKINPQSDKLVSICKALDMSLVDLLCDEEDKKNEVLCVDYSMEDGALIEFLMQAPLSVKRKVLRYYELLKYMDAERAANDETISKRNVSVIQEIDGNNIVLINDIIFKGKRSVDWKDVREYLKQYIGEFYAIAATGDEIYIGSDLPLEFAGSNYTKHLKGTVAKAKANAAQALPEMIEIALSPVAEENRKEKHSRHAKNGWYRYDTKFALPVYADDGELERYNIFTARLLIRHDASGKRYLYDVMEIKKETSKSCQE